MNNEILEFIERDIKAKINADLQRLGILYRLFSRIKEPLSIKEKLIRKGYENSGRRMQDIIGFRIVTYFNDDVKLLFDFFRNRFTEDNFEYDKPEKSVFKPLRKNLVCKFEENNINSFNDLLKSNGDYYFVDPTFEIQFRTTFSEGWHEVEHNMRYKCKNEWEELENESRNLDGLYAVMETSDQALKSLFDDLAYHHYTKKNWTGLIRNKFRLRFKMEDLKDEIIALFDDNNDIPKAIFKCDRQFLLRYFIDSGMFMSISMNNIVFLCNFLLLKNEKLTSLTPSILLDDFYSYLDTQKEKE